MTRIVGAAALVVWFVLSILPNHASATACTATTCNTVADLRASSIVGNAVVNLLGWNSKWDGGGGLLTSDGTANSCDTTGTRGTTGNNSNLITGVSPFPVGIIALQMTITTNTLNIPMNDYVSAFDPVNKTITIAPTNVTTGVANGTFTLNGDNGGTIFKDLSSYCFTRVTRGYNQVEWGAHIDGTGDDYVPLQNWLDEVIPGSGSTSNPRGIPQSHIAISGTSQIREPLICPANAVVQGFANDTAGQPKTGGKGQPTFTITPAGGFSGTALLTMEPYCRVSGVALDAGGLAIDVVDIAGTHAVIDGHSLLENGNNGVVCPGGGATQLDGLQIKDVEFENAQTSAVLINAGCENDRLLGDLIENSGSVTANAPAVSFASNDITIANGIIEGSSGPDLFINNAGSVVVSGMAFAGGSNNIGSGSQAPTIELANSTDITLTGNRFQGGGTDGKTNSDILFSGALNNVTLSNNIYSITSPGSDANVFPSYIYDVVGTAGGSPPLPTLTNVHLYETPERPAISVFSSAIAQALLAPLQVPQFTNNQLSGLVLSNGSSATKVNIAPGSAADSTNSTLITLASTCTVDFGTTVNNGPGGLDTGAPHANTTYFLYAIAAVGGNPSGTAPTPSCMASASPTGPAFTVGAFSNSGYQLATKGGYPAGSSTLYYLRSLAGVAVGDTVWGTDNDGSLAAATITGFSANAGGRPTVSSWPTSPSLIITVNSGGTSGIYPGMSMVDTGNDGGLFNGGCFPANAHVTNVNSAANQITVSSIITGCSELAGTPLSISGAEQLVINGATTLQEPAEDLAVSTGYYRLVGALYLDNNGNVVQFTQDGDTFYLNTPVHDVAIAGLLNAPLLLGLSVPRGTVVEALGRCVGGGTTANPVLLYTPPTHPGTPGSFSSAPGYSVQTLPAGQSFPYRLHTNSSDQIEAAPNTAGASLDCMTDGWVFHRAQ